MRKRQDIVLQGREHIKLGFNVPKFREKVGYLRYRFALE
jgi:hypothetical protein